eukprot:CAMPEP_0175157252 /NCGR_PEP_ID=MMETSP0087-20121206/22095_1 /TAXON_ID=136419 /ORGANISM="Unknown Unknown, Strain D1" /LENGTH=105 /DNA_ID=CAMNT_0016444833 /DNA_START=957 /DNA_END=1271 /DNA_ORIENTATION=+
MTMATRCRGGIAGGSGTPRVIFGAKEGGIAGGSGSPRVIFGAKEGGIAGGSGSPREIFCAEETPPPAIFSGGRTAAEPFTMETYNKQPTTNPPNHARLVEILRGH